MKEAVILVCAILVLALCPTKLQIIIVISVFSYLLYAAWPDKVAANKSNVARFKYPSESIVDRPCDRQSEKFADTAEVIGIVGEACAAYDKNKVRELAAELDTCVDEYMRVLNGQKTSYSSHINSRNKAYDIMAQCYIVTDEAMVPKLDRAKALLDSLFSSFDVVLHLDGKADRPGPMPNVA